MYLNCKSNYVFIAVICQDIMVEKCIPCFWHNRITMKDQSYKENYHCYQ